MAPRAKLSTPADSTQTSAVLLKKLAPFRMLCTKHALSVQYKTLELTSTVVRGMSSYGQMEVKVDLNVPEPCFVDADTFLTILSSLPNAEIKLKIADGVVHWECAAAKGKLGCVVMPAASMPPMKRYKMDGAWDIPADFGTVLDLGSSSCDNNTLKSIGMYGIVIDNREGCTVFSCDNVTASAAQVSEETIDELQELITLPPDGAKLLATLCKRATKAKLLSMETGLYYVSDDTRLHIKHIPKLEKDIGGILANFSTADMKAEIPPARISAFIKRVGAIAETKGGAHVELKVEDGQIALSFSDGMASSDEYYLIEALEGGASMSAVALNAEKLARAMSRVDSIILDHVQRKVIVLSGSSPNFKYLISGKSGAQA